MIKRINHWKLFNWFPLKACRQRWAWLLMVGLCTSYAQAGTMVLIPGFLSQGADWRNNSVATALETMGWSDGGNYRITRQQLEQPATPAVAPENIFYTVDLPTKTPIPYQAQVLDHYLRMIYEQRREPLILVGHSAGGIVARYWLVAAEPLPTSTLITIASPHLGTPLADLTRALVQTPLVEVMQHLGLGQAEGLYDDLHEEKPGNFLHWLNRQPHPEVRYVSIVRDEGDLARFDYVVPMFSQDMNQVEVLKGKSEYWVSRGGHFTTEADGHLLGTIVNYVAQ